MQSVLLNVQVYVSKEVAAASGGFGALTSSGTSILVQGLLRETPPGTLQVCSSCYLLYVFDAFEADASETSDFERECKPHAHAKHGCIRPVPILSSKAYNSHVDLCRQNSCYAFSFILLHVLARCEACHGQDSLPATDEVYTHAKGALGCRKWSSGQTRSCGWASVTTAGGSTPSARRGKAWKACETGSTCGLALTSLGLLHVSAMP